MLSVLILALMKRYWSTGFLALLAGAASAQQTQLNITDDSPACVERNVCRKDTRPGADPIRQEYEQLFDQPYPPPGHNPFAADSPFTEVRRFNEAFDTYAVAGARTEVKQDGDMLTVSVLVPDSAKKDLHVSVNDERILLSLAAPQPLSPYRIARHENLSVPDPPGIDPATALVDRRGDEIRVSFMTADDSGPHSRDD